MDLIHPHAEHDVRDALRDASRDGRRVLVVGGRQHADTGNPSEVDAELWTTLLDDVVAYEPAEMLEFIRSQSGGAGYAAGDCGTLIDMAHILEEQDANHLGLNVIWVDSYDEIAPLIARVAAVGAVR